MPARGREPRIDSAANASSMLLPRLACCCCCCLLLLLACAAAEDQDQQQQQQQPPVPPHHPGGSLPTASVWGPQEVETWLFAEGFGFLRKPFDEAQVNGRALLAMREHTLEVDFELEPSERCCCNHPA